MFMIHTIAIILIIDIILIMVTILMDIITTIIVQEIITMNQTIPMVIVEDAPS